MRVCARKSYSRVRRVRAASPPGSAERSASTSHRCGGCGTGSFLRQLIDWGADPSKLCGTELLPDRLEAACRATAHGVRWHPGRLDAIPAGGFDLVSAHTVFSSILDPVGRHALAAGMRRSLRPGG